MIFWKKRCRHINYEKLSVKQLKILDIIEFSICLNNTSSIMHKKIVSFMGYKTEEKRVANVTMKIYLWIPCQPTPFMCWEQSLESITRQ